MDRRKPHRRSRRRDLQKRRLNFDAPDELFSRLNRTVPIGFRGRVMRAMCEQLIKEIEREGPTVLHKVMDGDFEFTYRS